MRTSTFRPVCEKWECLSCGARRRLDTADWLLNCTGQDAMVYVSRAPEAASKAIQQAFRRRGGGGRVLIGLPDGLRLHVADVDISQQRRPASGLTWAVYRRAVMDIAAAIADPLMPVERGPRWVGAWRRPAPDGGERLCIMQWVGKDERAKFCHQFDIDDRVLRASYDWDDDGYRRLVGAFEWWRVNVRGLPHNPLVPMIEPTY